MKRQLWWLLLAAGACGVAGCQHCSYRPGAAVLRPAAASGPCSPASAPFPAAAAPPAVPAGPLAPLPVPGGTGLAPAPPSPPGLAPAPSFRSYEPPLAPPEAPAWQPSAGGVRLSAPQPGPGEPPRQAGGPQGPDAGRSPLPRAPVTEEPPPAWPRPGVTEGQRPSPQLPVGIPQFATVRDGVATGLKPLADGLEWMKENSYRTVLYLRPPGEKDAAERRRVEERGLRYLSLEVSPQALSRVVVDEFNRLAGDPARRPLFVYDKDGVLAGPLWYLYFRTAERLSDEEARTKAARLGLKDDQNGERRLMWLAIQKYLSEQTR